MGAAGLGIGAAWYEREHEAFGVPYPPLAERFERLEETLQIVKQMWGDDDGPYRGRHYRLAETLNSPQPLRRPHPPILVGGAGERKTLRLVARYADACNLFAGPGAGVPEIRAKLDVLRRHCEREGTDYARIAKTLLFTGAVEPTADGGRAFAEEMAGYTELGIAEVGLMPSGTDPAEYVRGLGVHVVPRLADL